MLKLTRYDSNAENDFIFVDSAEVSYINSIHSGYNPNKEVVGSFVGMKCGVELEVNETPTKLNRMIEADLAQKVTLEQKFDRLINVMDKYLNKNVEKSYENQFSEKQQAKANLKPVDKKNVNAKGMEM